MKPHYRLHYGFMPDPITFRLWPIWWISRSITPTIDIATAHYPTVITAAAAVRAGALA